MKPVVPVYLADGEIVDVGPDDPIPVDVTPKATVFMCGRGKKQPKTRCSANAGACANAAASKCEHALTGEKAGSNCGRDLCAVHGVSHDGRVLCPPHLKIARTPPAP